MGTLLVQHVAFGKTSNRALRDCKILLDNQIVGLLGEEIRISAGQHAVTVWCRYFPCNTVSIQAEPDSQVVLHYQATSFGRLAVFAGFTLYCLLVALIAIGSQWLKPMVEGMAEIPRTGIYLLCGLLAGAALLAIAALPWLLARLNFFSNRLSIASQDRSI